ncbi:hypothetical protein ACQR1W_17380 [Bradyrhizobium sp. HKCCYLS1011]
MTMAARKTIAGIGTLAALLGGLLFDPMPSAPQGWVSTAAARVGRPLTPMSYAGVARRTTRRAVVYGGAAAAAAAGAYAVSPGCRQVTDAYGRVYTQC